MNIDAEIYQDLDPLGSGQFFTTTYATLPHGARAWVANSLKPVDTVDEAVANFKAAYPNARVKVSA